MKKIPGDIRQKMVELLRRIISDEDKSKIRQKMVVAPKTWWAGSHLQWGMFIRNVLRDAGFTEKAVGIGNWDDYYVELVEEACGNSPNALSGCPNCNDETLQGGYSKYGTWFWSACECCKDVRFCPQCGHKLPFYSDQVA